MGTSNYSKLVLIGKSAILVQEQWLGQVATS